MPDRNAGTGGECRLSFRLHVRTRHAPEHGPISVTQKSTAITLIEKSPCAFEKNVDNSVNFAGYPSKRFLISDQHLHPQVPKKALHRRSSILNHRNAYAFSRPPAKASHERNKNPQQAPANLIHSFKAAYLGANKQEAPFVRYACGRFYVAGTTGNGMTHDQFSSLIVRLQSRAGRPATSAEQP